MSHSGVFKYSSFAFVLTWLLFKFSKQTSLGCHSYVKFWLTSGEDLDTVCACQKFRVCAFCRCARDCKRSPENDYFRDLTTTQVKGIKAKTLARVNAFDPVFRWTIRPCFILLLLLIVYFPITIIFADRIDACIRLQTRMMFSTLRSNFSQTFCWLFLFWFAPAWLLFTHTHTHTHTTTTRDIQLVFSFGCLSCGSKSSMPLT